MPQNKSRFVHLCQQLLAFGTVLAVAAPAATVVSLDIVAPAPGTEVGPPTEQARGALVASEPVKPEVEEIPVEGVEKAGIQALTDRPRLQRNAASELAALSAPQEVTGYATVGVTWESGVELDEDEITVSVRSLKDGVWSDWEDVEYHDDHGPDPDSAEALKARPGTDPVIVGDVDEVQVKAVTATGEAPADMQLAVVDPGLTEHAEVQQPAIDTAELEAPADAAALSSATTEPGTTEPGTTDPGTTEPGTTDPGTTEEGVLTGTPADVTPKPKIFSRAQWGADERMRDKPSLNYYEVHAGFVHHTVNANGYTRKQVPSLIRGIYAYHTQSKGWSDIGYNFVVDRFGRIWEGRYGGVDRPVVGAHTLGYNEYSFAASALGNFDVARPSAAMLDAYGRLFAWKLSLHGIDAASSSQSVGGRTFKAINGHRDAGQTACPGRYLYAKVGTIRSKAAGYQKPFTSRTRSTDVTGSPWPDIVVRDKETKQAKVVRTGGQLGFQPVHSMKIGFGAMDLITATRDLTGDNVPDLVARNGNTGRTNIYPGNAQGRFEPGVLNTRRFRNADELTGAMDMTGDGRNDLVVRIKESKKLYVYPGNDNAGFRKRRLLSESWSAYQVTAGVGDFDGDGKNDLIARDGRLLYLVPGTGKGIAPRVQLPNRWGAYDLIAGLGDVTNDGKPDIIARARKSKLTYIFPGDGSGGLGHRFGPFNNFKGVSFLAANGQLAGDRGADLVARVSKGRVVVYPNNGAKNIEGITDTGTRFGGLNLVLNVGDWNGDGHGDVMTRRSKNGAMQLRLGDGKGGFAPAVLAGSGWKSVGLVAAVGDITGDGYPDLMGQPSGKSMRIYPGNGSTGFKPSYVAHSPIASNGQTGLGLWNSDGSPDSLLRRSDGSLLLYPGNGPGGLLNGKKIGSGTAKYDWLQSLGDADGDGRPDLVGREKATGILWLLPGRSNGFGARRFLGDGFEGYDLSS